MWSWVWARSFGSPEAGGLNLCPEILAVPTLASLVPNFGARRELRGSDSMLHRCVSRPDLGTQEPTSGSTGPIPAARG